MANRLRGAIIGAGEVAVHGHAPGWRRRPDVEIVAAADPRPDARAPLEAALPRAAAALTWRDSIEAVLDALRVDFVDVCSPPAAHAAAIRAALERDVHVLCEKPLVLSEEELDPLVELAETRGLVLATVHNWRFAPPVVAAREAVRSGTI